MARDTTARYRPLRRLTLLLISPNKLRRPSDRIETVNVLLLSAVFLAAVAAAPYLGMALYHRERAGAAHLYPTVAILSQSGPANTYQTGYGLAAARWRVPGRQWRSGTLTTQNAPDIAGAPAGAQIRVWLTGSGEPAVPPASQPADVIAAVSVAFIAACGAGAFVVICYWLCRLALDRRRLAAWDSDWASTGPRWTTRRQG